MALVYSIDGGADAGLFIIDEDTGVLAFKVAPDFEKPGDANKDGLYEVTVRATDETDLYSTHQLKVTVADVLEGRPPEFTSPTEVSLPENTTAVMTVTATDPDDGAAKPPSITSAPSVSVRENQKSVMTVTAAPGA